MQNDNRVDLASEFRAAIIASQLQRAMLQETSCDWCGGDVQTVDDHQTVDGQFMCNPCVEAYEPMGAMSKESIKQALLVVTFLPQRKTNQLKGIRK